MKKLCASDRVPDGHVRQSQSKIRWRSHTETQINLPKRIVGITILTPVIQAPSNSNHACVVCRWSAFSAPQALPGGKAVLRPVSPSKLRSKTPHPNFSRRFSILANTNVASRYYSTRRHSPCRFLFHYLDKETCHMLPKSFRLVDLKYILSSLP